MLSESQIKREQLVTMNPEEALHALAREITPRLGDGWSYKRPNGGDYLPRWAEAHHSAGYSIHFAREWNKPGRVSISGSWPRTAKGGTSQVYGESMPSITVAESRGVEAIVKEIERRFMPEFLRVWEKAVDQARKTDEYEAGRAALLARLAKVAGVGTEEIRQDRNIYLYVNGQSIEVEVSGPDSARVKVSLPAEGAARVLAVAVEEAKKAKGQ